MQMKIINNIQSIHLPLVIKVVENEEEKMKAMLIRAIVYMHEQNCPYQEEFDLNDFTATQIIGMIDGEPILTARIRYFEGFAKIERLAIRYEYRGHGYGRKLISYLLGLCRQKGFTRFYLHAQERLQSFYESYGFKVIGDKFGFSDHGYIEMVLEDEERGKMLVDHIGYSPMILNRPENNMNDYGPLERLAEEPLSQIILSA